MLKLYIQDLRWRGCIVVIAVSEVEARKLMQKNHNYESGRVVKEHEIKEGLIYVNYGDS